jgi:DNA-directed RNA polymerase specialized sigma24 family protein
MLRLYNNSELSRYIIHQAIRHFSDMSDREDAVSEALEKIMAQPVGEDQDYYKRIAYNAIHAFYERTRRRAKRESAQTDISTCTDMMKGERFGATLSCDELVEWMQDKELSDWIKQMAWQSICDSKPFAGREVIRRLAERGMDAAKKRIRIRIRKQDANSTTEGMP